VRSTRGWLRLPLQRSWRAQQLLRSRRGAKSFNISQKGDKYLLTCIKNYIGANSKIQYIKKADLFYLEIYNKDVLNFIKYHFSRFPLLGEKS
jgi:hypothetical protein